MKAEYRAPIDPDRKPLQELLPLKAPLSLYIDPCNVCNFKCDFCFQKQTQMSGGRMSEELFNKIISDMKEFNEPFKMVNLYCFGEPLLNPHIADFIRALKNEKVAETVRVLTNGSLLTKERSEQIIEAGLDKISFSIYGLDDESYRKFSSAKVSFQGILDNIRYFYSIKGDVQVHVKIAGDYFDHEQKKLFLTLFGEAADTIHIDNAANVWPELNVVSEEENHHIYGMQTCKKICLMPFYQMVIQSDGLVSACCVDYDKKVIVGDIKTDSIKKIWEGEGYRKLRRNILEGRLEKGTRCQKCEYPMCGATVDITPYREMLLKQY